MFSLFILFYTWLIKNTSQDKYKGGFCDLYIFNSQVIKHQVQFTELNYVIVSFCKFQIL